MLSGLRVLIVEDEPVLSDDLSEIITAAEGVVVGPVATVKDVRALVKVGTIFDVAILDVNLADGVVTPVLEALQARAFLFWYIPAGRWRRMCDGDIPASSPLPSQSGLLV